jgi:hypothetical protein
MAKYRHTKGDRMTRDIRFATLPRLAAAMLLAVTGAAGAQEYEAPGTEYNMPVFAPALKAKMTYPMAWSPAVKDLKAWRDQGRAKVWEATWRARSCSTSPA